MPSVSTTNRRAKSGANPSAIVLSPPCGGSFKTAPASFSCKTSAQPAPAARPGSHGFLPCENRPAKRHRLQPFCHLDHINMWHCHAAPVAKSILKIREVKPVEKNKDVQHGISIFGSSALKGSEQYSNWNATIQQPTRLPVTLRADSLVYMQQEKLGSKAWQMSRNFVRSRSHLGKKRKT